MTLAAKDEKTELFFRVGHMDEAKNLICSYHYSRRMAGNVQYVCTWHRPGGLFGDYGDAVAACTFSIPPTKWSVNVLELSRLVKIPRENANLTSFLSLACGMLRRRGEHLIVSFADFTQGHHGGVYQAASWNFSDYREPRIDGLIVGGTFVPGRSCNSRWGTRSPTRLSERLGDGVDIAPRMDEGKYLYWKSLTSKGRKDANSIGLKKNPYPKPHMVVNAQAPKPTQLSLLEVAP